MDPRALALLLLLSLYPLAPGARASCDAPVDVACDPNGAPPPAACVLYVEVDVALCVGNAQHACHHVEHLCRKIAGAISVNLP